MLIFSKSGKITPQQDKTNITFHFSVPKGTEKLIIHYEYSPKYVEDSAEALRYLQEGRQKYKTDFSFDEFRDVKNLVTLSFDECGEYRGACHRQPNKQTVIIAEKDSTYGVENRKIKSGDWDVMLNVHFAGCDIDYKLEIEAEGE